MERRCSGGGGGWFVLFFLHYLMLLVKPWLYVEDFLGRECYRKQGFGELLLVVVLQVATMGNRRVEWCSLDWNSNVISFYEEMGTQVLQEWRICRLTANNSAPLFDGCADLQKLQGLWDNEWEYLQLN
ncbi:GCN5-related N-acetyltransferase 8-like [Malania oleifera]|uniref:GCN5-related N-acetyltransferase 8-like n=1 Tax=Malania oleifera TaxID=397392 RepID=UPI0025ADF3F6|nr:GCN5-related N-acetyltransferase 8-like [Malania oleifera]